jgi:hypothetical protein
VSIILSPVGPYFKSGLKAISLYIDDGNVRAWPGGVGQFKIGGNYAPTIVPQVRRTWAHAVALACRHTVMHACGMPIPSLCSCWPYSVVLPLVVARWQAAPHHAGPLPRPSASPRAMHSDALCTIDRTPQHPHACLPRPPPACHHTHQLRTPPPCPQVQAARDHGCSQVIYTLPAGSDPEDAVLSECGSMNVFLVLEGPGGLELVTPPLDGTILPGVTRDSILRMAAG